MMVVQCIFWMALGLLLYAYFIYPVLLWMICRVKLLWYTSTSAANQESSVKEERDPKQWPAVSVLIPAFNEESHLPAKLANCEQIDYPADRLEIIFVSDGSTDGTDELLQRLRPPRYHYFRLATRHGKPSALNAAVSHAKGEILLFSDSASLLNPTTVRHLVRPFRDPLTGVVCGAQGFRRNAESAATEGIYWSYETALRRMEGSIGATLTASGAIYAVRRSCFRALDPQTILDDFVIPMTARRLGYQVVYEPQAQAWEEATGGVGEEFTRRARLAAGGYFALGNLLRAALPSPLLFWTLASHKVLRWLVPLFLLAMAGSSLILIGHPLYRWAVEAQAALYLWAAAGLFFRKQLAKVRFGLVGYFLVAMNAALLVGLARWAVDRQPVTWTRVD